MGRLVTLRCPATQLAGYKVPKAKQEDAGTFRKCAFGDGTQPLSLPLLPEALPGESTLYAGELSGFVRGSAIGTHSRTLMWS